MRYESLLYRLLVITVVILVTTLALGCKDRDKDEVILVQRTRIKIPAHLTEEQACRRIVKYITEAVVPDQCSINPCLVITDSDPRTAAIFALQDGHVLIDGPVKLALRDRDAATAQVVKRKLAPRWTEQEKSVGCPIN
ncbi:MAG: hypothetical protein ACR2RB_07455 [Gammaproteobacteria bacterium]